LVVLGDLLLDETVGAFVFEKRTGLGSRMALLIMAFASAGNVGATTLRPGVLQNQASMLCEW
jgi:hypothetical protein